MITVWWARSEDYRTGLDALLSPVEVDRAARLRRPADRIRQVLGAVVLRLAASAVTGVPAGQVRVERTCADCGKPHGRPTLPGTGLHASVTHSGELVGVALTRAAPVGLDVEQIAPVDIGALRRSVLQADEPADDLTAFFTYWTRKEAVVKATGDGLTVGLPQVLVSGPAEAPALLAYPGRADLRAYLADLEPDPGYRAAVAVLTAGPVPVTQLNATGLLR